jgi:hypothetical protein
MLSPRANFTCRVCLAAALLLANGTAPAVRHAHAGGHEQHSHVVPPGAAREVEHEHPHEHPHTHPHAAELVESCAHLHFNLFGVELPALPVPADDEDSDHSPALVPSPLGVGTIVNDLPGSECNRLVLVSLDDGLVETRPVAWQWADRFASVPAVAAFLCDTARHERSGVQLI